MPLGDLRDYKLDINAISVVTPPAIQWSPRRQLHRADSDSNRFQPFVGVHHHRRIALFAPLNASRFIPKVFSLLFGCQCTAPRMIA